LFCYFVLLGVPTKKPSQPTTGAAAVEPKPHQIKVAASSTIEKPVAMNPMEKNYPKGSMLTQICIRSLTLRICLN
jgi:hypothetical protein